MKRCVLVWSSAVLQNLLMVKEKISAMETLMLIHIIHKYCMASNFLRHMSSHFPLNLGNDDLKLTKNFPVYYVG